MPTHMPGHTVKAEPSTHHIVVRTEDGTQTIAESNAGHVVHETGIQDRYYIPREDLTVEIEATDKTTHCPFKGDASYWTLKMHDGPELVNAAWSYDSPLEAAHPIKHELSFWGEGLTVEVDGEPVTV